jgi:hypothetical protein
MKIGAKLVETSDFGRQVATNLKVAREKGGDMKVTHFLVAAGIALAASSAQAGLTTYDFDGFADGTDISGVDLGGAILTAGNGGIAVTGGVGSGASGIDSALNMFGVINVSLDLRSC